MKYNKTSQGKDGIDPDVISTVPSLGGTDRCIGCPYPGIGFICWSQDGSCIKTDMERFSHRRKGR